MSNLNAPAPDGLRPAGLALWESVVSSYELRVDELVTLRFACRALDLAQEFDGEWAALGSPLMSRGSQGQEIEHPLIGSADKQRKASDAFLKRLKLPDLGDSDAKPNQNRAAGMSRWASAHGSAS